MRRVIKVAFLCFISLFAVSVKAAECSNEAKARLKKDASNVKMIYMEETKVEGKVPVVELDGEMIEISYDYFKISLNNITKEMYINITSDVDDEKRHVTYNATKNGTYTFDWIDIDNTALFKYEIYGSASSPCSSEKIGEGYLRTPRYNVLHTTALCEGLSDLPECDKYILSDLSEDELVEKINEYKEKKSKKENEKNATWYGKAINYVKQHKVLAISGVVVIAGAGVALVVIKRKRRAI